MAIFEQGEIVAVAFGPSVGHEPTKTRPALVVSATDFNMGTSMTMLAPITSVDNGFPFHVPVSTSDGEVTGFACVEQIRAMDLCARPTMPLGRVRPTQMNEVLNLVGAVFGI